MKRNKSVNTRKRDQSSLAMKKLRVKKKKIMNIKSKLVILKHISKRNCALLPYLDDESLHTLGEFIFNNSASKIGQQTIKES